MKHTPGKWVVEKSSAEIRRPFWITGNDDDGCMICSVVSNIYDERIEIEEAMANARLIAAAPELLEACYAVIDDWHSKSSNFNKKEPKHLDLCRRAIKKATEL